MEAEDGKKMLIMAPIVRSQKGTHEKTIDALRKDGFVRVLVDGEQFSLDDAIVLDQAGKVTEGSAMNLFLVEGDTLVTTQTTDNILVGITRDTIIELGRDVLGMKVEEREISRSELYVADEAFYCGTGAQVSPIVSIDNRPLGKGVVGEHSKELQKLYFDVVRCKVEKYKKWCTPIYD